MMMQIATLFTLAIVQQVRRVEQLAILQAANIEWTCDCMIQNRLLLADLTKKTSQVILLTDGCQADEMIN